MVGEYDLRLTTHAIGIFMFTGDQFVVTILAKSRERSIGLIESIVLLHQSRRYKFGPFTLWYTFLAHCSSGGKGRMCDEPWMAKTFVTHESYIPSNSLLVPPTLQLTRAMYLLH